MASKKKGDAPTPQPDPEVNQPDNDPDFQFALKALLAAYEPLLKEELARAEDLQGLVDEERATAPNCEDELALAGRIFDKFFTEQVATRLLPQEALELLGPFDRWRWCYAHIRCCMQFGWLICRCPLNFRLFNYYLYRFWICVRKAVGDPVSSPLTPEQQGDFRTLAKALTAAYKPFIADELAAIEIPVGIPDEVVRGTIDCFEGEDRLAAVFERLLNPEVAPALLGRKAFEAHRVLPFFWFCRCWCLCALRFGCCLACARNLVDVLRCLRSYRACLRECFAPIRCELIAPHGCAEEEPLATGGVGLEIKGTAAGGFFGHYTLQWRKVQGQDCADDAYWSDLGIRYPGGGTVGYVPVAGGTLGWLETTTLAPASFEIRVCVFTASATVPHSCCCSEFALFKVLVWIDHVGGAPISPTDPFDQDAVISGADGKVVPVGCCVTVGGSAFVGDCSERKIKCIDLRWGLGFLPGPGETGFLPSAYAGSLMPSGPVCYTDSDPAVEAGKRAPWNWLMGTNRILTTYWDNITVAGNSVWKLAQTCFPSPTALPSGVETSGGCPDPGHRCQSGKYTLLLDVTDTDGNHYYDTQHVWFDNKPMIANQHVAFAGLKGLPGCTDLHLGPHSEFVPPGAPCNKPWPVALLGIAYDEYIDETDTSYPSDNFDYYRLWITRQGGPTYQVPISTTLAGTPPLIGTSRVGDPGVRCESMPAVIGCPPPPTLAKMLGTLTMLDLRIFDECCAEMLEPPFAPPPGFALPRGECCGYTFQLYARDKTRSSSPVPCHAAWSSPWAVCICNDLEGPCKTKSVE